MDKVKSILPYGAPIKEQYEKGENMAKPHGNTKIIIKKVAEIQTLVEQATACIDTRQQWEIRSFLQEAQKKCFEIRNLYDPQ